MILKYGSLALILSRLKWVAENCIAANEAAARLTNPHATCIGICLNTAALNETEARDLLGETEARIGLPCVDAVRTGVARLVDCIPI